MEALHHCSGVATTPCMEKKVLEILLHLIAVDLFFRVNQVNRVKPLLFWGYHNVHLLEFICKGSFRGWISRVTSSREDINRLGELIFVEIGDRVRCEGIDVGSV